MAADLDETPEMVVVPRVPTEEMIEAAYWANIDDDIIGIWQAMVDCWLETKQRESAGRT